MSWGHETQKSIINIRHELVDLQSDWCHRSVKADAYHDLLDAIQKLQEVEELMYPIMEEYQSLENERVERYQASLASKAKNTAIGG
ncbi:MAG: hypothetical protein ISN29_02545 [Gammaproteobacteria bacterium AqS3]|nr:hypothetical protein [Gammaproteobacteria bacterium AqS3]